MSVQTLNLVFSSEFRELHVWAALHAHLSPVLAPEPGEVATVLGPRLESLSISCILASSFSWPSSFVGFSSGCEGLGALMFRVLGFLGLGFLGFWALWVRA